jgi:hypothetical protein
VRERAEVRARFKTPVTPPNPSPSSSPLAKGRGEKKRAPLGAMPDGSTISCGRVVPEPLQIVYFSLVTLKTLLY